MTPTRLLGALIASLSLSAVASATVVRFTDQALWTAYSSSSGASVVTETFNSIADGFYASPTSGTVGGITWSATATGGLYAHGGQLSTNLPATVTFTITPGVKGVGGNFFGTDGAFSVVPAVVEVTLNDGSAYIGFATSPADFVGFYSTTAEITSISVTGMSASDFSSVRPTADNLYFAVVPAPGAVALLAVAGMMGLRRRG